MTGKKLRIVAYTVVAAFLAGALVGPTATAQSATVTLFLDTPAVSYSPTAPLVPDTGTATVSIGWTYNIQSNGYQLAGLVSSGTQLKFDPPSCDDNNVIITGSQSYPVVISEGNGLPTQTDSGTATFQVVATQDAPGETPIRCNFSAKVEALFGTQVPETSTTTATTQLQVAYLGLISANVPRTIKQAGPQKEISYSIEVTNLGNARSNILFDLTDDGGSGWNPVAPTPIVLESSAQGGQETTKTVNFLVSTPFKNGWNNKDTTFVLTVTPASTKDPESQGTPVTVNVLARVRGVYVPSLEPMVLLGAVVGAGLVARLMRDEE